MGTQTRGGYAFRRFTGQPLAVLEDFGVPERVTLTLTGASTPTPEPLVRRGSHVFAGQRVAEILGADRRCVVSPVSGAVSEIRTPAPGTTIVTVDADGSAAWQPVEPVAHDWRAQPRERLEDRLYAAGIAGLPTRLGTAAAGHDGIEHVVLNAVSADVYNINSALLFEGRSGQLAEAADILRALYPRALLHVAVDALNVDLERALRVELPDTAIRWHRLPARYPQQMDVLLHDAVSDRPRAPGASAIASGTLAIGIQDALAVRDAVAECRPAIDRVVALCGPGFTRTPHVRLRIGTPVAGICRRYLRPQGEHRLVENSLLSGAAFDPVAGSIGASTSLLVAIPERERGELFAFARPGLHKDSYSRTFVAGLLPTRKSTDTNRHGEGRACIACGFCESVCPARIMPHLLHRYVRRDIIDETLVRYGIARCIDCRLCTYVCTSKIDVASLLRTGREKLAAEGLLGPSRAPEATP